jgi:hypothetical protein
MHFLNKSLRDMTDGELKQAYAHWDYKVRAASSWGSIMAQADEQRGLVEAEQARRRQEAKP